MPDDQADVARRISRDLGTVGLAGTFGLYALREQLWLLEPSEQPGPPPTGFGDHGYVAVVLGSQRFIEPDSSAAPSWVDVASFVQDCIVDELGFGWPELQSSGRFDAVLQPGLVAGELCWLRAGESYVSVGSLDSVPPGVLKVDP